MDVIKRRQRVGTRKNQIPTKSKAQIRKIVKKSKASFYSPGKNKSRPFEVVPLQFWDVDKNGSIWFLIPAGMRKNFDYKFVQLLFQGDGFSDFLLLYGTATISKDQEKMQALRKANHKDLKSLKESKTALIKLLPAEGYYWDKKLKKVVELQVKDEDPRSESFVKKAEKKIRLG